MERRQFTREFKLEAVNLIKERGWRYHRPRTILEYIRRSCAIG